MRLSFGLLTYKARSWVSQSYVKAHYLTQAEAGIIPTSEANNRIGIGEVERPDGCLIWLHCVDPDMAQDFAELIELFDGFEDRVSFVLTTETSDVFEQISDQLRVIAHQFVVHDASQFADQFLDHWKPEAVVWLSDSVYPLVLGQIKRRKIPCVYVNATISKKMRNKYLWYPNFIGTYLSRFTRILASSDASAIRLRRLHAPRKNLEVMGGFKAGAKALPCDELQRASFVSNLSARPVWLAAHVEGGEVAALAKTQRRISRSAQRLLLIIDLAPSTKPQSAKIRLEAIGLRVGLKSKDGYPRSDMDVFIMDEDSDLGLLYRVAPISFIGGSLVNKGGNDPFEAAALGSAILHGHHVDGFKNSYDRLADAGAARMVQNSEMLSEALSDLISPDKAAEMAHAAWEVCTAGAEANDRVFELLTGYLNLEAKDAAA